MIIKWFVDALSAVVSALLGLLPTVTMPAWIASTTSALTSMLVNIAQLGAWIPLGAFGKCLAFVLLCSGVAVTARLTRIAISHVTGGGGSAA